MRINHIGFASTPREAKESLGLASINAASNMKPSSSMSSFQQFSFSQVIESWSGKQIAKWIEGLGDQMNPYIGLIRKDIRCGTHLELVDDDSLYRIGIIGVGPRKIIVQAIQLLLHFCYEAPNENLQSLAMNVVTACHSVAREMLSALHMREKAMRRSEIVTILNNVTSSVSNAAEHSKRLIFWLDRSPFDENATYIEKRNRIAYLIWNLVRNVNVQPKNLFETAAEIVRIADDLEDECRGIIECDDSLILCTAFVESAVLKRHEKSTNWGINLQSSYRGVHVISEIKVGSPADLCSKIDAGDEIIMINGRVVIGWDLTSVAQRIGSSSDGELKLLLNKRPRESTPVLMKQSAKTPTRPLAKMAPGSQATNTADDGTGLLLNVGYPLTRRRSMTLLSEIIKLNDLRNRSMRRSRRVSIASGSARSETRCGASDSGGAVDDLLELIIHPASEEAATRIVRRARTMRHQPDGYVRSFIDNKLVHEIEDDVVADQLPFNVKCPTDFAEITIVEPHELQHMSLPDAKVYDDEWRAPYQEFTQSYRAPAGDSNLSGFSKMTSSMEESSPCGVLPSPSTSSMNSVSSPAPFKSMSMSITEWPSSAGADDFPGSPNIFGMEKIFEGWIRRRKTSAELNANEVTNKWPKTWMCLRGPYLVLYPTQHSRRHEMTINITKATISETTDLKTSKKFVFRVALPTPTATYYQHFSCYNSLDFKSWMQKIKLAKEIYGGNVNRVMSTSISYCNDADGGTTDGTHYNTLTGLPSLMSQQETALPGIAIGLPGPPRPHSGGTLPRSGLLSTLHNHHHHSLFGPSKLTTAFAFAADGKNKKS